MKVDVLAVKILFTAAVLAFAGGCLSTLYGVVVVGQYWDAAPIFLTFVVAGLVPLAVVWAAVRLTFIIWKSK